MFTKLNIVDNQPILTNFMVTNLMVTSTDLTVDLFRLELSIFQACEYYNLRSLHPMFTKLDTVDYQLVLINYIE